MSGASLPNVKTSSYLKEPRGGSVPKQREGADSDARNREHTSGLCYDAGDAGDAGKNTHMLTKSVMFSISI